MNDQNTLKSNKLPTNSENGGSQILQSVPSFSIAPSLSELGIKNVDSDEKIKSKQSSLDLQGEIGGTMGMEKQKNQAKKMRKKERKR